MLRFALLVLLAVAIRLTNGQTPPAHFYPFGAAEGDSPGNRNNNGWTGPINFQYTDYVFYGTNYQRVWVNTNGFLSFNHGVSNYFPGFFPIGSHVIASPYWVDINLNRGGEIWFRETTDTDLLRRISRDVRRDNGCSDSFNAEWAFIATWWNTMRWGSGNQRVDFQAIVVSDGVTSFSIFNYGRLEFTDGDASLGSFPQVGFNAGDNVRFVDVPGSHTADIATINMETNSGVIGRFVYIVSEEPTDCDTTGTGDDPHMLVHAVGLDMPICFEFDGFNGAMYHLVADRENDFELNAAVFTPEDFQSRQTFFSKAMIGKGDDFAICSVNDITLNNVRYSWEEIRSQNFGEMTISSSDKNTVIIKAGYGIEVTVIRDFSKTSTHLDIFVSQSSGLSESTSGIIGEFLYKHASVSESMNGDATLHFPASGNSVSTRNARRPLLNGAGHVNCWEVTDVEGMMDDTFDSQLITRLNNRL